MPKFLLTGLSIMYVTTATLPWTVVSLHDAPGVVGQIKSVFMPDWEHYKQEQPAPCDLPTKVAPGIYMEQAISKLNTDMCISTSWSHSEHELKEKINERNETTFRTVPSKLVKPYEP